MEPPRKIDLRSIFADASPEILELLRESEERLNARPPKSNLLPGEEFWRDHQVWLQEQGYMLRPRYHPDWVPSVLSRGENDLQYPEDAHYLVRLNNLDARKIATGQAVMLKKILKSCTEMKSTFTSI
ncbi:hypothetical protein NLI96_g10603 [Meripilus lineatus]|uniref:Uncharacterized protein n=1 Tax=Meripilus lineatus TaxID=2056292 RepID=A0AAD5UXX9_9APHY|nr:hypothetical protein NLI96_g10603 [Physisporinus lineatus]